MAEEEMYEPTAEGLIQLLKRLRAPDGCPWDRAQTRETLGRSLAGETAELLDAIDRGSAPEICDRRGEGGVYRGGCVSRGDLQDDPPPCAHFR